MQNLSVFTVDRKSLSSHQSTSLQDWIVDSVSKESLLLHVSNTVNLFLQIHSFSSSRTLQITTPESVSFPTSSLVGFCMLLDRAVVAFSNGLIGFITQTDISASSRITFIPVGQVDSALLPCISGSTSFIAASGDREIAVFFNREGRMFLMNSSCEIMYESVLQDLSDAGNAFVNVGWGSKETQFHGSEGKLAALAKPIGPCRSSYLYPGFERYGPLNAVGVGWRADSKYFAVSAVHRITSGETDEKASDTVYRRLLMFSKEGQLVGVSEMDWNVIGSPMIAWRPESLLVAMVSCQANNVNELSVTFWEKNGLRHGGFQLRTPEMYQRPVFIQWNSDGSLLMIGWNKMDDSSKESDVDASSKNMTDLDMLQLQNQSSVHCVQIYSSSNFEWYLKAEFSYHLASKITFDIDNPNVFYRIGLSDELLWEKVCLSKYTFADRSTNSCNACFIIDGKRALGTEFALKCIPPPMYDFSIDLSSVPSGYIVDSEFFYFWSSDGRIGQVEKSSKKVIHQFSLFPESFAANSFFVVKMLLLKNTWYSVVLIGEEQFLFVNSEKLSLPLPRSPVASIISSPFDIPFIHTVDGNLYAVVENSLHCLTKIPFACDIFEWISVESASNFLLGYSSEFNYLTVVKLSDEVLQSNLNSTSINVVLEVYNVNSYYYDMTGSFVAACITVGNELKFFKFNAQSVLFEEHSTRSLEKGSYIYVPVPSKATLVMALPRGNLEMIVPRAMLLSVIQNHFIANGSWCGAFELCRKHRIDLNILPSTLGIDKFVDSLPEFIRQINRPDWLNLFITALDAQQLPDSNQKTFSKLLGFLRNSLSLSDSDKFFEPILTCYAKQNCFSEALQMIRQRYSSTDSLFDRSVKYLLFLQPANDYLYKSALSLYDWECALAIAARSQMDPKEYQPFIERMQGIHCKDIAKFIVDDYLEHYDIALEKLFALETYRLQKDDSVLHEITSESVPELIDYVKRHGLFKKALFISMSNEVGFLGCRLWIVYSERLRESGKFIESAIAYLMPAFYLSCTSSSLSADLDEYCNGNAREKAADILIESGNVLSYWKEIVALSNGNCIDRVIQLFNSTSKPPYLHIHQLLIQKTLLSLPPGISTDSSYLTEPLCNAHCWLDAFRLSTLNETSKSYLLSSLLARSNEITQLCTDTTETFTKRYNRLQEVRSAFLLKPTAHQSEEMSGVEIDAISVISHLSILSGMTRASTKSRRKAAKAKLRSREGGIYEEDYLIFEIESCFKRVHALTSAPLTSSTATPECREVLEVLLFLGKLEIAVQVQSQLSRLTSTLNDALCTVFDNVVIPLSEHDPTYIKPWQRPSVLSVDWKLEDVLFFDEMVQ